MISLRYQEISVVRPHAIPSLRQDRSLAIQEINYIFRDYSEYKFADNFYKLGVIRYNKSDAVLALLEKRLLEASIPPHAKYLKIKCESILKQLQSYKQLQLPIPETKKRRGSWGQALTDDSLM